MKHKYKEWVKRYLPAEVLGTITAVIAARMALGMSDNALAAAAAGTLGENVGYYGYIIVRDVVSSVRRHSANQMRYGLVAFAKDMRNIIIEFGFAEIVDTFFVRPFWLYTMPRLVGHFELGILLGKLAADVTFYIPAVIGYEFRKKKFHE